MECEWVSFADETEWEKAARGGLSRQRFPWGNTITQDLANYTGNTGAFSYDLGPDGLNATGSVGGTSPATSPGGTFAANGYGLNDMAGNVSEWCWDWFAIPYAGGTDPSGPDSGSNRVFRGGSWNQSANSLRCAQRGLHKPGPRHRHRWFPCCLGPRSAMSGPAERSRRGAVRDERSLTAERRSLGIRI